MGPTLEKLRKLAGDANSVMLLGSGVAIVAGLLVSFFMLRSNESTPEKEACNRVARFFLQCKLPPAPNKAAPLIPDPKAPVAPGDVLAPLQRMLIELQQAQIRIQADQLIIRETCRRNKKLFETAEGAGDPITRVQLIEAMRELCKGE